MSKLFPTVSKQNPCPICGREDWCALGDFKIKCMREPSEHPSHDGGWYHPYGDERAKMFRPAKKDVAPPLTNGIELMDAWTLKTDEHHFQSQATRLGVSVSSLEWLNAAYAYKEGAWAFPMRDGMSNIIGIRLRNANGDKWAVRGSRQGLFIPTYFEGDDSLHDTCFITEGPTDCAAVLSMCLYSIGRPSCNSNHEQLIIALKRHQIRRVVIISDNDDKRRADGRQWNPGLEGARALGAVLRLPHVVWIPPTKDVREFVRSGGTKQVLLDGIKNLVWKRK